MIRYWKAILGVFLIFVLGFTSGVVCSSIVVHRKMAAFLQHPGTAVAAVVESRLTRNLNLDPEQKQQIHGYFMENVQQRKALNQQIQPQMQTLNLQTFKEINATLHPDQQERFRQNVEEFRRRFAAADGGNPPLPGVQPAGAPVDSGSASPTPQH